MLGGGERRRTPDLHLHVAHRHLHDVLGRSLLPVDRVGLYVPGHHAHGYEALTDLLLCYHVTEEYDPDDPDEHSVPWNDPRVARLWSTTTPILSERDAAP